jgi:hypothetical protein
MAGNNTLLLAYNVLNCNGAALALGADLATGATTITFAAKLTDEAGANVPTLTGNQYIRLVLWDTGAAGVYAKYEIVWLTAYTAGATTGTIMRHQEGTSDPGVSHVAASTTMRSAVTAADLGFGLGNEAQASVLVNATSAGDAGGRSDHFLGSSLAAAWTTTGLTIKTGKSVVTPANTSSSTFLTMKAPYTPSGAFRIEARVSIGLNASVQVMLAAFDSAAGIAGDAVAVRALNNGDNATIRVGSLPLNGGAFGSAYSDGAIAFPPPSFIYLALARDGSNNWTAFYSFDRNNWQACGTGSKTFTVAQLGFMLLYTGFASIDFIDVVS